MNILLLNPNVGISQIKGKYSKMLISKERKPEYVHLKSKEQLCGYLLSFISLCPPGIEYYGICPNLLSMDSSAFETSFEGVKMEAFHTLPDAASNCLIPDFITSVTSQSWVEFPCTVFRNSNHSKIYPLDNFNGINISIYANSNVILSSDKSARGKN